MNGDIRAACRISSLYALPDAGHQALVAQGALELPPLPREQPGEPRLVEVGGERVGAEAGDARDLRGSRTTYTASRFCVPASVRSKPSPVSRATRRASGPLPGRGGPSGSRSLPVQPARAGEVGDEVQARRRRCRGTCRAGARR